MATDPHPIPTRAFWVEAPGRGSVRTESIPSKVESQVRVRTLYSGISRGTEGLVFRGEVPASQHQAMRAPFQEGDFPAPVKYGYCNVGQVEEVGGRVEPLLARALEGQVVFSLHPHQEQFWAPPESLTPLPGDLPPDRAILAANMETALNAVWDGAPGPGDRIVVVGGGVVGLLVARLCRDLPGADVTVVDVNPLRKPVAQALGVGFVLVDAGDTEDGPSRRRETGVDSASGADVVFHASGNARGLVRALSVAGDEATVVEVSWYGARSVPLPLGEAFHSRRLTLRSSQVGRIPPTRVPRWSHARRMAVALELLQDPQLDLFITGESTLEELPDVMAVLGGTAAAEEAGRASGLPHPGQTLCHRIRYPRSGS
ncbi:MAG: zinc-binding alcohol dehydrogenase [Gemmatimonadota bacterium]